LSRLLTDAEANLAWGFSPKNPLRYGQNDQQFLSDRDFCLLEEQDKKTRESLQKVLKSLRNDDWKKFLDL
jgi:hypothetical protein